MDRVGFCAGFCFVLLSASPAAARPTLLQTVDLNDRGMSTEGGKATLYRASKPAVAPCRIEVIHYGETGKAIYLFTFGSRLYSAARTDYEYNAPIYMVDRVKIASKHTITLQSSGARKRLSTDFTEYRSFFDPGKIARCGSR